MKQESGLRVFLGPLVVLAISFFIYFIRYPLWQYLTAIEPLFGMLILSYLIVFIVVLFLLKKDSKKSLSSVFGNCSTRVILIGVFLGLAYLGLWFPISAVLGSNLKFTSSTILRDYETYTFHSLPLAFTLYLSFSVFGAFAEEVAYRGYVQTRISSRYGHVIGITVSTIFFSLQHIHIFQTSWLAEFFQTQFFHVLLFGIFGGYLFFKTEGNIWSTFSMHALTNVFSVSVPIVVTPTFQFAYHIAETASFVALIMLLRFLPQRWIGKQESMKGVINTHARVTQTSTETQCDRDRLTEGIHGTRTGTHGHTDTEEKG